MLRGEDVNINKFENGKIEIDKSNSGTFPVGLGKVLGEVQFPALKPKPSPAPKDSQSITDICDTAEWSNEALKIFFGSELVKVAMSK